MLKGNTGKNAGATKPSINGVCCVDEELLRSWLGLPPGPWPPNHYAILGLEVGHCDPAEAEPLVLAQMDRLRMHQLQHPELVTEGMNRLAQALICLTDPVARAAHDAELLSEEEAAPLPDTYGLQPATPRAESPPPVQIPAVVEEPLPLPPPEWEPKTKRELFARLVMLRRLLTAWQRLKPVLEDPEEPLDRPAMVLALLEAVAELQPRLDQLESVTAHTGGSGALVLALLRQRVVLPTFRTLKFEERDALSRDWRRAQQAFTREQERFRSRIRDEQRLRRDRGRVGKFLRWVSRTPEVVLLLLTIATVVMGILRVRRET